MKHGASIAQDSGKNHSFLLQSSKLKLNQDSLEISVINKKLTIAFEPNWELALVFISEQGVILEHSLPRKSEQWGSRKLTSCAQAEM